MPTPNCYQMVPGTYQAPVHMYFIRLDQPCINSTRYVRGRYIQRDSKAIAQLQGATSLKRQQMFSLDSFPASRPACLPRSTRYDMNMNPSAAAINPPSITNCNTYIQGASLRRRHTPPARYACLGRKNSVKRTKRRFMLD